MSDAEQVQVLKKEIELLREFGVDHSNETTVAAWYDGYIKPRLREFKRDRGIVT